MQFFSLNRFTPDVMVFSSDGKRQTQNRPHTHTQRQTDKYAQMYWAMSPVSHIASCCYLSQEHPIKDRCTTGKHSAVSKSFKSSTQTKKRKTHFFSRWFYNFFFFRMVSMPAFWISFCFVCVRSCLCVCLYGCFPAFHGLIIMGYDICLSVWTLTISAHSTVTQRGSLSIVLCRTMCIVRGRITFQSKQVCLRIVTECFCDSTGEYENDFVCVWVPVHLGGGTICLPPVLIH